MLNAEVVYWTRPQSCSLQSKAGARKSPTGAGLSGGSAPNFLTGLHFFHRTLDAEGATAAAGFGRVWIGEDEAFAVEATLIIEGHTDEIE
jgi:hypothetical protein